MSPIDFGRHSDDYATHRPGFPPTFYARLDALIGLEGCDALDLATGPGVVALELAARGCSVLGIDIAPGQIAAAEASAERRGLQERARFRVGRAEQTELEDASIGLATAGQCWHWFDGPTVLAELRRVLVPGGHLVIANYCYLAGHSDVARRTEELVLQFNPGWPMANWPGVFPEHIDEVRHGSFELIEQFCYDHDEPFDHERWRGRVRTCNGVGSGGLAPEEVHRFDQALAELLEAEFPGSFTVPHRVWAVVARKPTA